MQKFELVVEDHFLVDDYHFAFLLKNEFLVHGFTNAYEWYCKKGLDEVRDEFSKKLKVL